MARNLWLAVRLNESEMKNLDRAARSARMSRSAYARSAINGSTVNVTQLNLDGKRLDEVMYALKKSSSNLNQLAYRANRGDYPLTAEVEAAMNAHKRAAASLSALIDETRPRPCS